jgi:hypothetical protein
VLSGPARYARNLRYALTEKLAGERPLILQAIGHAQAAYPVVNLDDVYLVLSQQKFAKILDKLPIIITLGETEVIMP